MVNKKKWLVTWLLCNNDSSVGDLVFIQASDFFQWLRIYLVGFLEAFKAGIESEDKANNIWIACNVYINNIKSDKPHQKYI